MNALQPWQLLLVSLAGWINLRQQDAIAYIQEENRILKGKLKGRRIRSTDDERRRPRNGFNRRRSRSNPLRGRRRSRARRWDGRSWRRVAVS